MLGFVDTWIFFSRVADNDAILWKLSILLNNKQQVFIKTIIYIRIKLKKH